MDAEKTVQPNSGHSAPKPVALEVIADNIPQALIRCSQWVCWRYLLRDGKWTKVPIDARTGRNASPTNPSTWSSFETMHQRYREDDSLDGVGFVFSKDDSFCGIDLDECLDGDGNLVAEAQSIVGTFDTYTETSPSGTGVKLYIIGTKPDWAGSRSKKIERFKEVEIYDEGRYFALTGHRLQGLPNAPRKRQPQLEHLCSSLWNQPESEAPGNETRLEKPLGDEELLARARAARNGDQFSRLFDGDTSLYGGDDSRADIALCTHLAFWSNGSFDQIDRLFRQSKLYRVKWEREDYRRSTIRKAINFCSDFYARASRTPTGKSKSGDDGLPRVIEIGTDEHRVVSEVIDALQHDKGLFQRSGHLVRVVRITDPSVSKRVHRVADTPTIAPMTLAHMRDRITRFASLWGFSARGKFVPKHPANWLVQQVLERRLWPKVRPLLAVAESPVLRSDGTILQQPGYDEQSHVLYMPNVDYPEIPQDIDAADADAAVEQIREMICEFRFASEAHEAAYISALLTAVGRHAFTGPTPLFLFDANVRGAGKSLLAKTIGWIVNGRELPASSYAHDTDEMRKRITAIALAGDQMVLLDNLVGTFGNAALDAALTSTQWQDRRLGVNEQVSLPLNTVWLATGNNVVIGGDMGRRVIHIRLEVMEERPEERSGFKHPDLHHWVTNERPRLLTAALTILAAYIRAGRPSQGLTPFGSYEGWSSLPREAVVWVGLADPCETRELLQECADPEVSAVDELLVALEAFDPQQKGVTVAELLKDVYTTDQQTLNDSSERTAVRNALDQLVSTRQGAKPSTRAVGKKFSSIRKRVINDRFLDWLPNTPKSQAKRWRIERNRPAP